MSAWRGPGMPVVMAYLTVRDVKASLEFYTKAFGFTPYGEPLVGEKGELLHAEMKWHEAILMLGPEGGMGCAALTPKTTGVVSPVGLYVYCEDVDARFAQAVAAGATPTSPPENMFWGDRVCQVTDPDGLTWSFGTFKGPPPT